MNFISLLKLEEIKARRDRERQVPSSMAAFRMPPEMRIKYE